jgi:hypothetical protein
VNKKRASKNRKNKPQLMPRHNVKLVDWDSTRCPMCGEYFDGERIPTFHHIIKKDIRRKIHCAYLATLGFEICRECHNLMHLSEYNELDAEGREEVDFTVCGTYVQCDWCFHYITKDEEKMKEKRYNKSCYVYRLIRDGEEVNKKLQKQNERSVGEEMHL